MPVSNARIAFCKQSIGGDAIGVDIRFCFFERPVRKRIDLDQTGFIDFDDGDGSSVSALRTSAASNDTSDM